MCQDGLLNVIAFTFAVFVYSVIHHVFSVLHQNDDQILKSAPNS